MAEPDLGLVGEITAAIGGIWGALPYAAGDPETGMYLGVASVLLAVTPLAAGLVCLGGWLTMEPQCPLANTHGNKKGGHWPPLTA